MITDNNPVCAGIPVFGNLEQVIEHAREVRVCKNLETVCPHMEHLVVNIHALCCFKAGVLYAYPCRRGCTDIAEFPGNFYLALDIVCGVLQAGNK